MSAPLSLPVSAPWSQRYEDLRCHVLEGRRRLGADPRSLVFLCHQGLAGWMGNWRQVSEPLPPLPSVASEPPLPVTPLWQQQLTLLVAHMTAQHLRIL